jgi:dTMP kinase
VQVTDERGRFVTFEGGEGAGKSTQLLDLRSRLEQRGLEVVSTREPGGSPRAEAIRSVILAGAAERFGPFAETLLFGAARADHVATTIRPALARGAVVLCDRFIDSTRVYQGELGRTSHSVIAGLERLSCGDIAPDLTLVLDLPAEIGLARAARRRVAKGEAADRFEREGLAYHEQVREAFLAIARAEPGRCRVVDANAPSFVVADRVWSEVARGLALADEVEAGCLG